ncbi:hypothetical protein ACF0H5_008328 [Mactra antiquata]
MVQHDSLLCILYWIHTFMLGYALDVYSGSSACNKIINLNSKFYAGILDFNPKSIQEIMVNRTTICKISFIPQRQYYVAVKFYQQLNSSKIQQDLLGHGKITILEDGVKQTFVNGFSSDEVIGVNITMKYEIQRAFVINNNSHNYVHFDVLFYTFQLVDHNHSDTCTESGYKCLESTRCLPEVLACSRIYDFCLNGFKNKCRLENKLLTETNNIARKFIVSYTGVYIFFGCLLLFALIIAYMCICRSVISFCKHKVCESARNGYTTRSTILQQPRCQADTEIVEGDAHGANMFLNAVNTVEPRYNDNDDVHEKFSSLPPSYSYLEQQDAVLDVSNEEECSTPVKRTSCSCYLPPSYSSVLNHEEYFKVHKHALSLE